jgi:hypothetical protein
MFVTKYFLRLFEVHENVYTFNNIIISAAAQMEKNSATNIMTAPAAVCLPIIVKEFIQPLKIHNKFGK